MGFSNRVYELSPMWIQNLFVSLYGKYRRKLRIDNMHFRKWQELIESNASNMNKDSYAFQEERLRDYLLDASQNSEYWAQTLYRWGYRPGDLISKDDLKSLPTIDKQTLINQKESVFNKTQTKREYVDVHTSGTTGGGLNFRWSKDALAATFAFYWNYVFFRNKLGDKHGTFNGNRIVPVRQSGPPYWRRNKAMNQTIFSSFHITEKNIGAYTDELSKGYVFLNGYPSVFHQIAVLMLKHNIKLENIAAIYTSSETLFDWQREKIEAAFPKARLVDLYMNGEQSVMISQCEYGKYHVNPFFSTCWFRESDVIVDGRRAFEPIGTSTINNSTFFINYETKDLVVFDEDQSCQCNREGHIVKRIVGRSSDFITTPDGRKIGPAALSLPLKYSDEILESQIVQETKDRLLLKVVTYNGTRLNSENTIREELSSRIGKEMNIEIRYVSDIEKGPNGKFRAIVRNSGIADNS